MIQKYLNLGGLDAFWKLLNHELLKKLDKNAFATQLTDGIMSKEDKIKLDKLEYGAEVNQNAYSFVDIQDDNSTLEALDKKDTLTLVGGRYTKLTGDRDNRKITIDSTHRQVEYDEDGLMSAEDKIKIDRIDTTNYGITEVTTTPETVTLHDTWDDVNTGSTTPKPARGEKKTGTHILPESTTTKAGVSSAADKITAINLRTIGEVSFLGDTTFTITPETVSLNYENISTTGKDATKTPKTPFIPNSSSTQAGIVTAEENKRINTNTYGKLTADSGEDQKAEIAGDILTVAGGTDISTETSSKNTVTITHKNVEREDTSATRGTVVIPGNGDSINLPGVIDSISSSQTGHVTGAETVTIPISHGEVIRETEETTVESTVTILPGNGDSINLPGVLSSVSSNDQGHVTGSHKIQLPIKHDPGTASNTTSGFYKFSTDGGSHISEITDVSLEDLTSLGAAPIESPEFTGTPTAPTAEVGTDTSQLATTAYVKAEINSVLSASNALRFKGVLYSENDIPASGNEAGDTYMIGVAGSYVGNVAEVGDLLLCIKDETSVRDLSGWMVVQANIDGAVTGPTSSVDSQVALFSGSTGKIIKAASGSIGGSSQPIYINAGKLTPLSDTIGSGKNPVWLNEGTLERSSETIGSSDKPVYLKGGVLTEIGYSIEANVASDAFKQTGHYTPGTSDGTTPTSGTQLSFNTSEVITGVTKDDKGHVIGITKAKLPSVDSINSEISGKADKSATVSTVDYDTTNKKVTKTINGSKTDVVTSKDIVLDGKGMTLGVVGKYSEVISDGSDLNNYRKSGNYTISSGTSLKTLLNIPEGVKNAANARLIVVENTGTEATDNTTSVRSNYGYQNLIVNGDSMSVYYRAFDNNGLKEWKQVNLKSDPTLLDVKKLTSDTIDSTAGSFVFDGTNAPFGNTDWVGLQIGDSLDKFQIRADSKTLFFRQNDSGGTDSENWSDWITFVKTTDVLDIENYTTSDIGYGTSANRTKVPTVNKLAYWNGAYSGTSSNLAYCSKGAFGDMATKNSSDYLRSNVSIPDHLVVNSTDVGSSAVNGASENGKTRIVMAPKTGNLYDVGVTIQGSGATTVTSDSNGVITVESPEADNEVLYFKVNGGETSRYYPNVGSTFELKSGSNVSLSADSGVVTISATNTTYSAQAVSSTTAGLISSANNRFLTQQASVLATSTSVSNLSPQYGTHIVTPTSTSAQTLGISSYSYAPTNWKMDIIIRNTLSGSITINIPSSGSWVSCDGVTSMNISAGKVGEINIIYANQVYYVRTAS